MRWPHGWCRQNQCSRNWRFLHHHPFQTSAGRRTYSTWGQETPVWTILEQVSTPLLDRYIIYRWHRIQAWIQKETHLTHLLSRIVTTLLKPKRQVVYVQFHRFPSNRKSFSLRASYSLTEDHGKNWTSEFVQAICWEVQPIEHVQFFNAARNSAC